MLYNRASADPDGKPWSERKKYVYWDEAAGEWTGADVPDFEKNKRPDYVPPEGAKAQDALAGNDPFVMQGDGKAWLFAPAGVVDGPLPTHYEPAESVVENALYKQQANPTVERIEGPWNRENPSRSEVFPFQVTTYRLTEHHTAGGMSRTLPYLAELQPEFFVEVSPELAELRGLTQRRVRHAGQRPDGDRGEGAGHRAGAADPAARRAGRAPDRHAVPLVLRGHLHRRLGQRPAGHRARPEHPHPGGQGQHLRHRARTASARAGAAGVRRVLPPAGRRGLRAASASTAATRSRPTRARDRL